MRFFPSALVASTLAVLFAAGCGNSNITGGIAGSGGSAQGGGGSGAGGSGGSTGKPPTPVPNGGSGGSTAMGGAGGSSVPLTGFTPGQVGGYKLGPELTTDMTAAGNDGKVCDALVAVVRDFKGVCMPSSESTCFDEPNGHPDFETFAGDKVTPNLVAAMLGSDRKPVYTSMCEAGVTAKRNSPCPYGQMTTSKMDFDQWYRFTPGVNKAFLLYLQFQTVNGVSTFASNHFFPLDGAGWGNSGTDFEGMKRNFGFTTEVHSSFKYAGGESFTFTGDDDVWVFINNKLALDLGGLHPEVNGTIMLDALATTLGITKGNIYPMDLFHAERHTDASNFRVDTNFAFVDCGSIIIK